MVLIVDNIENDYIFNYDKSEYKLILQKLLISNPEYFKLLNLFFNEIKKHNHSDIIKIDDSPNIIILYKNLYFIIALFICF